MILIEKNYYNEKVNKAGMQSSNKTGLVLKISVILFVLLALVVYKLNDHFKKEKQYIVETQLRNKVVQAKTTVSSQLSQLRNVLSSYEMELSDTNINWVQLDPFFAIARLDDSGSGLKVSQMLVRSNTPAERWNSAYLEKAITINKSLSKSPILAQLFQDKSGAKFLIIRFKTDQNKELVVAGAADYFQKFFDIERGESGTALLATTENLLAAHSEGDYIATQTQETQFSAKKYLLEKEEITGTNLIAMNYALKKKVVAGFAVPWSIIGITAGFGCILVAILFYSLDSIERKIERYKKQERAQIYKDTVSSLVNKSAGIDSVAAPPIPKPGSVLLPTPTVVPTVKEKNKNLPKEFYSINQTAKEVSMKAAELLREEETTKTASIENIFDEEKTSPSSDKFLAIEEEKIDLSDIEKALALDDFDNDEGQSAQAAEVLREKLTPKKISVSSVGAQIDKPQFAMKRKDFRIDEFKVNIRRPETK